MKKKHKIHWDNLCQLQWGLTIREKSGPELEWHTRDEQFDKHPEIHPIHL